MNLPEFLMDAQRAMLVAAVDEAATTEADRREAVTAALTEAVRRLTEELAPPVVVEIGAHEAAFSRALAPLLPSSRVIAFEAHPRVFAKYAQVCAEAGVDYRNACVAEAAGTARLKSPLRADGTERLFMGSLLADSQAAEMAEHEVEAVTLDGALGADADKPSVLWIDVEGAAGPVLAGGARTLAHSLAVYIEVEETPRWEGQILAPEVTARLAGFGLRPVLRDIQRASRRQEWQCNVLYLREA